MFSTSRMAKASSPGVAPGLFWQMPAVWLWLYPCTIKPRTASFAVRDMATAGILAGPTCWDVCRRRSAAALARSHLQWHRPIQTPHSWHGHSWTRAVRYSAPLDRYGVESWEQTTGCRIFQVYYIWTGKKVKYFVILAGGSYIRFVWM